MKISNQIEIIEYYYATNPNLHEILHDNDTDLNGQLYANRMNFIHYIMRAFKSRNYLEDAKIEEYKDIPWNYDIKYTNAEDNNDIYTLKFEISDKIFPFQEYDPFRLMFEDCFHTDWWLFRINVNKIWCYTYEQAQNVIEVLTGITDKPWHYEE